VNLDALTKLPSGFARFDDPSDAEQHVGWQVLAQYGSVYTSIDGWETSDGGVFWHYSHNERHDIVVVQEALTDEGHAWLRLVSQHAILDTPAGVRIAIIEHPAETNDEQPYVTAHFYTGATAADGTPIVATVHAPDLDTAIDFIDSLRFEDGSKIPATTKVPGD
jgi:hypothetical protein